MISGARSDIGPDMERISLLSLFPVAVTGPQPSGLTGPERARTVTVPSPAAALRLGVRLAGDCPESESLTGRLAREPARASLSDLELAARAGPWQS